MTRTIADLEGETQSTPPKSSMPSSNTGAKRNSKKDLGLRRGLHPSKKPAGVS
jgi:hypothetical protein